MIIPQTFTIDSRDRDTTKYPNSSTYQIRIPTFKDVTSVELASAEIPLTGYVVNEDFYTAVQNDDYSSCDLIIKNVDDNEDRIDSLLRNLYIQEIMILE